MTNKILENKPVPISYRNRNRLMVFWRFDHWSNIENSCSRGNRNDMKSRPPIHTFFGGVTTDSRWSLVKLLKFFDYLTVLIIESGVLDQDRENIHDGNVGNAIPSRQSTQSSGNSHVFLCRQNALFSWSIVHQSIDLTETNRTICGRRR